MPELLVEVPAPASPPATAPAPERRSLGRRAIAAAPPYLYLAPAVIGLVAWVYWPLIGSARLSFYDWNLLPTAVARPVGWDNYEQLVELPELGRATLNTGIYILGLLPFTVLLPVVIAVLARGVGRRSGAIYRAAVFAPFLVAPVAAAIVWRWLLAPSGGPVNQALGVLGAEPVSWLREPLAALVAIVVIAGWKMIGFATLLVSAGLSGTNDDYADAAAVDGASPWQITRWVTLPLLSPTLVFLGVFTVLVAAQVVFPLVDTLTRGGPGDATTNLYYLIYEKAFSGFDAGLASAAAVLFFAAFALVALAALRALDRWSFHDD